MKYLVVFEFTTEYPQGVYSDAEYDKAFGHLHPDYRPRCIGYNSKKEADAEAVRFTKIARKMYGR